MSKISIYKAYANYSVIQKIQYCIIQLFHRTHEELKDAIKKIKQLLRNENLNIKIMFVEEEYKINTLHFI